MKIFYSVIIVTFITLQPFRSPQAEDGAAKALLGNMLGAIATEVMRESTVTQGKKTETQRDSQQPSKSTTAISQNARTQKKETGATYSNAEYTSFFKKYPALVYGGSLTTNNQIDRLEAERYAPYFINPQYAEKINNLRLSLLETDTPALLTYFNFRNLSLGVSYEEVMKFAEEERMTCASELVQFYNMERIIGLRATKTDLNDPNPPISQHTIGCDNAVLAFTPLGRLYSFSVNFRSDEDSPTVMKRLEDKFPNLKWTYACDDPGQPPFWSPGIECGFCS